MANYIYKPYSSSEVPKLDTYGWERPFIIGEPTQQLLSQEAWEDGAQNKHKGSGRPHQLERWVQEFPLELRWEG